MGHGPDGKPSAGDIREAAAEALGCGLSVVPPREDGTKAPIGTWKRFQQRLPTPADLASWYGADGPPIRTGMGIVCGPISGNLECLEFDAQGEAYGPFKAAAEALGLGDLVEKIEAGYLERSASGGLHLLYRCGEVAGNTELARRYKTPDEFTDADRKAIEAAEDRGREHKPIKVLVETRGTGGYIVTAPTNGRVHPTGGAYERLRGGFATIATITPEERDALLDLARTFDRTTPADAPDPVEAKARKECAAGWSDTISPVDDFNARATWPEVLPHGWTEAFRQGETQYWRRPDKDRGHSATINRNGSDRLYVFSSSTPFEIHRPYSKFAAYALLDHGGDFKAAVAALSREGYGTHKRWVLVGDKWELRVFPNPCPRGERVAKPGEPNPEEMGKRIGGGGGRKGPPPGAEPSTNGDGHGAGPPAAGPASDRPTIVITTEEHIVIDQGVDAVAADPTIFQRAHMLVTVQRDVSKRKRNDPSRPAGTPRIAILPNPRLRERLTKFAAWAKPLRGRAGTELVGAHPPEWAVAGVSARGEWPSIRGIEGVVEAPTIRADGSILDTPGWDEATGLLYEPNAQFPSIPESPARVDARRAADLLLSLVAQFPFVDDHHRAAWLAALLTPLARWAIDGPCPLFLFDANTPGTGKSLLCEVISVLATGRPCSTSDYPEREEEMAKVLLAIALAADLMVVFDNVATGWSVGGKSLDRVLTSGMVRGRILGRSEMTPDLPISTVFYANGNNLGVTGDGLRRIIYSRLRSQEERPEERGGFAIPDLIGHVRRERGNLVVAALTIIRAYVVAGRPDPRLTPMDYRAWCGLIRNAVHWATGLDPCRPRAELRENDPETSARRALVHGWAELPGSDRGLTVAEAVGLLNGSPGGYDLLRGALMERSRKDELPSRKSIGMILNASKGRVVDRKSLQRIDAGKNTAAWKVVQEPGGTKGTSGTDSGLHAGNCADSCNTQLGDKDPNESHQPHQSHPEGDDPPSCGGCFRLDCPKCNPGDTP
jgi:hypothetical protein